MHAIVWTKQGSKDWERSLTGETNGWEKMGKELVNYTVEIAEEGALFFSSAAVISTKSYQQQQEIWSGGLWVVRARERTKNCWNISWGGRPRAVAGEMQKPAEKDREQGLMFTAPRVANCFQKLLPKEYYTHAQFMQILKNFIRPPFGLVILTQYPLIPPD